MILRLKISKYPSSFLISMISAHFLTSFRQNGQFYRSIKRHFPNLTVSIWLKNIKNNEIRYVIILRLKISKYPRSFLISVISANFLTIFRQNCQFYSSTTRHFPILTVSTWPKNTKENTQKQRNSLCHTKIEPSKYPRPFFQLR